MSFSRYQCTGYIHSPAGIEIDRPHRVIVIDNEESSVWNVPVITVEDYGSAENIRKYHRVERREDITVTCFDGEGLISKEFAKEVDKAYCGKHIHTSFQKSKYNII